MLVFALALAAAQPAQGAPPPPIVTPVPPPPPIIRPGPPASASDGAKAPARAQANLASYVSDRDYPDAAIRAGEQGIVGFRLDVGPDGRVTGCTIIASSGSSALDSATCRIMYARARFTPARDSQGRPVADQVHSRIRWVLPEPSPMPPEVESAMRAWAECLRPLVRQQLDSGAGSSQEIADRAFAGCAAQEQGVAALLEAESKAIGPSVPPQTIQELRRSFVEFLDRMRAGPKP